MIKVSVIIPVYNGQEYIKECIESVLFQKFLGVEMIIVDDGSTDDTPSILRRFEQIPNITIIYSKHLGLSISRNIGIDAAKGEYILFVDADDRLHDEESLELVYCTAKKQDAKIVTYDTICFDINGIASKQRYINRFPQSKYFSENKYFSEMMNSGFFCSTVWSYFFKREIINNIRFIPYIYYEDTPFLYELLMERISVYYLNRIIYEHRLHSDSIMGSELNYKKVKSNFIVLKQLVRINKRKKVNTRQEKLCINWNARLLMDSLDKLKDYDDGYEIQQLFKKCKNLVSQCEFLNSIDNF